MTLLDIQIILYAFSFDIYFFAFLKKLSSFFCLFVVLVLDPKVHDDRVFDQHFYEEKDDQDRWSHQKLKGSCWPFVFDSDMFQMAIWVLASQDVVVTAYFVCISLENCIFSQHCLGSLVLKLLSLKNFSVFYRFLIDSLWDFWHFRVEKLAGIGWCERIHEVSNDIRIRLRRPFFNPNFFKQTLSRKMSNSPL